MKTGNSKTKAPAFLGAALMLLIALLFTGCPNSAGGSGSGSGGGGGNSGGGGGGTPSGSFAIAFGVDGGNGTLKAEVDGTEIGSGDMVAKDKSVLFTATADTQFAVEKWMNGGTAIAEAGANTTYTLTVTAAADIKVKFKYTGAALTLNTAEFTREMGTNFTYKLVTAGSGSYTAVPENPGIITLDTANLNSYGNIRVTCNNVGATRIRVTDTLSGQTELSGLITVTPAVVIVIPEYFEEAGVRYHVTNSGERTVSVTASTGSGTSTPYTGTALIIPKEVIHDGVTCTVTGIEDTQLWGATLQEVTVAADNSFLSSQDGVIFNKDKTVLLWYPCAKPGTSYSVPSGVTMLGHGSFKNISALTSVTLPAGLKYIRDYVFAGCDNIATLALPTSLEYIGNYSLYPLKVSSMVVPEHITTLGDYFLAVCPALTSVELPSTLTQITWYAFSNDPVLNTVTCKAATPPVITAGDHVFENTPVGSATLRVPSGSKALYEAAVGWKDFGMIEEF